MLAGFAGCCVVVFLDDFFTALEVRFFDARLLLRFPEDDDLLFEAFSSVSSPT